MSVFLFFSVLQTENKINDLRIATMHAIDKKLLTRPAIVRVDFFKILNVI
jgi:hypothetical protein